MWDIDTAAGEFVVEKQKKKDAITILHNLNTCIFRSICADPRIWQEVPTSSVEEDPVGWPVHRDLKPEMMERWALFSCVPDPDNFGSSFTPEQLRKRNQDLADIDKLSYMRILKKLFNIHKGEAVEINGTAQWVPANDDGAMMARGEDGKLDHQWHFQYGKTAETSAVLHKEVARGSMKEHHRCNEHDDRHAEMTHDPRYLNGHLAMSTLRWDSSGGLEKRTARVLTLLQVLFLDVTKVTMQEAYAWYCQQQLMVHVKTHSLKAGKSVRSTVWPNRNNHKKKKNEKLWWRT